MRWNVYTIVVDEALAGAEPETLAFGVGTSIYARCILAARRHRGGSF